MPLLCHKTAGPCHLGSLWDRYYVTLRCPGGSAIETRFFAFLAEKHFLVFDISILILLMVLDLLEPVRVADVSKQSHRVLSQLIKFCFVVFCKPKAWPQKRSKTWFGG